MDIHINVQKKHIWFLGGLMILLIGVGFVIAFTNDGSGVPSIMGHSADEIEGALGGGMSFGSWTRMGTKTSGGTETMVEGVSYTAQTDLTITVYNTLSEQALIGLTSGMKRIESYPRYSNDRASITFPVKKGETFQVDVGTRFEAGYTVIWKLPIISGGGSGGFIPEEYTAGSHTEGTTTFPNGMIMKWGEGDFPGTSQSTANVAFDTPFPNAVFMVISAPYGSRGDNDGMRVTSYDKNGFSAYTHNWWTDGYTWFAIGY